MKRILAKTTALLSAISIGTFGFSPVITQAAASKYSVENPTKFDFCDTSFSNYDDAKEFSKTQGAGYEVVKKDGNWAILYVHGDINDDKKIGVPDITMLKQSLSHNRELTPNQKERADIDNNGVINITDLSMLELYYERYYMTFKSYRMEEYLLF